MKLSFKLNKKISDKISGGVKRLNEGIKSANDLIKSAVHKDSVDTVNEEINIASLPKPTYSYNDDSHVFAPQAFSSCLSPTDMICKTAISSDYYKKEKQVEYIYTKEITTNSMDMPASLYALLSQNTIADIPGHMIVNNTLMGKIRYNHFDKTIQFIESGNIYSETMAMIPNGWEEIVEREKYEKEMREERKKPKPPDVRWSY